MCCWSLQEPRSLLSCEATKYWVVNGSVASISTWDGINTDCGAQSPASFACCRLVHAGITSNPPDVLAGGNKALIQLGEQGKSHLSLKGFKSFLAWRSAYLTRLGSTQNRLYVMMNWFTTMIFGRDLSRW